MSDPHDDEATRDEPSGLRRLAARWPMSTMAIEVFSIVLGVLLALGVSEWRQDSADRELAIRVRANLFAELEANRQHLAQVHAKNLVFQRQEAGELADDEEKVLYQPAWGLQDTAWNVARDTGALQHLSFEAVNGFSSVYGFQQAYRAFLLQLSQAQMMGMMQLGADDTDGGESTRRAISDRSMPIIELLITNEQALLEAYDRALSFRD